MIYIKSMNRIFIDVREPYEYARGHVEGAFNIPPAVLLQGLPAELAGVPKDAEIILYCMTGARSRASIHILGQYGFTNLVNGINKDHVKAQYK